VQICRTYCGPISMRGSAQGTIAYEVPSQPNVGDARRIRDESAKAAPPRTRSLVVVVRFIDLLRRRSDSAPAGLAAAVVAGGNEATSAFRPTMPRCWGTACKAREGHTINRQRIMEQREGRNDGPQASRVRTIERVPIPALTRTHDEHEQCWAQQSRAGQGRAGQGRAGQGRAGQGLPARPTAGS